MIEPEPSLRPLLPEQLLIDHLPSDLSGQRALVVSPGRAQLANHLISSRRFETVQAWYLDLHDASQASAAWLSAADGKSADSNAAESDTVDSNTADGGPCVEVLCGADLPHSEYDLVAVPVLKRGESELTRELLQQGHMRLASGGYLAASVDNPKDNWLHDQLQSMLEKVTCVRTNQGSVYWGKKTTDLKKVKNFACEFAFRDEADRMIAVISRPGVFSHRRLDAGARQLMLAADIGPEDNVLDMGCGAGAVALAAAFRTSGTVFGVDSNARAIECLKRAAELNGLTNIAPVWNADGQIEFSCNIDIALANPPYYGNDAIAQHFVDTALAALRPGGALLVVNKKPQWYTVYFHDRLEDIAIMEASSYFIACGRKP